MKLFRLPTAFKRAEAIRSRGRHATFSEMRAHSPRLVHEVFGFSKGAVYIIAENYM